MRKSTLKVLSNKIIQIAPKLSQFDLASMLIAAKIDFQRENKNIQIPSNIDAITLSEIEYFMINKGKIKKISHGKYELIRKEKLDDRIYNRTRWILPAIAVILSGTTIVLNVNSRQDYNNSKQEIQYLKLQVDSMKYKVQALDVQQKALKKSD